MSNKPENRLEKGLLYVFNEQGNCLKIKILSCVFIILKIVHENPSLNGLPFEFSAHSICCIPLNDPKRFRYPDQFLSLLVENQYYRHSLADRLRQAAYLIHVLFNDQ